MVEIIKNQVRGKAKPANYSVLPKEFDCFKEIEAHLDYEDIFITYDQTVADIKGSIGRFTVPVLHTPMTNEDRDYLAVGMLNPKKRKDFIEGVKGTINLAKDIRPKEKTLIVLHAGEPISYKDLYKSNRTVIKKSFNEDLDTIVKYIEETNANVDICVENLCTMTIEGGRGYYRTFGYDSQLIEWIDEYNHPNIGLTLDTCHLLHTLRYPTIDLDTSHEFESLEAALKLFTNSKSLKLVHLANCVNFGLIDLEHGYFFDESKPEDMKVFDILIEALSARPDVPITLELNELDHSNPLWKIKTYELINKRHGI